MPLGDFVTFGFGRENGNVARARVAKAFHESIPLLNLLWTVMNVARDDVNQACTFDCA